MLKYLLALLLAIVCLATLSSGNPAPLKVETDVKVEVKDKQTAHVEADSPEIESESTNTEPTPEVENEGDKKHGYRQLPLSFGNAAPLKAETDVKDAVKAQQTPHVEADSPKIESESRNTEQNPEAENEAEKIHGYRGTVLRRCRTCPAPPLRFG